MIQYYDVSQSIVCLFATVANYACGYGVRYKNTDNQCYWLSVSEEPIPYLTKAQVCTPNGPIYLNSYNQLRCVVISNPVDGYTAEELQQLITLAGVDNTRVVCYSFFGPRGSNGYGGGKGCTWYDSTPYTGGIKGHAGNGGNGGTWSNCYDLFYLSLHGGAGMLLYPGPAGGGGGGGGMSYSGANTRNTCGGAGGSGAWPPLYHVPKSDFIELCPCQFELSSCIPGGAAKPVTYSGCGGSGLGAGGAAANRAGGGAGGGHLFITEGMYVGTLLFVGGSHGGAGLVNEDTGTNGYTYSLVNGVLVCNYPTPTNVRGCAGYHAGAGAKGALFQLSDGREVYAGGGGSGSDASDSRCDACGGAGASACVPENFSDMNQADPTLGGVVVWYA